MAADRSKPFLKLDSSRPVARRRQGGGGGAPGRFFDRPTQRREFGPAYERLAAAFAADPTGSTLRTDATGLAPERLVVFTASSRIDNFARAAVRAGFTFIAEEPDEPDQLDAEPELYLLFPDAAALKQLLRLWNRWQLGEEFDENDGNAPWRHLFQHLTALRAWGPQDRVSGSALDILRFQIDGLDDEDRFVLELELIYQSSPQQRQRDDERFLEALARADGKLLHAASHGSFSYEGRLVDVPIWQVQLILNRAEDSLAGSDPVVSILPQSLATTLEISDTEAVAQGDSAAPVGQPIAAVFDAVPLQNHPLLTDFLVVDDPHDLEALAVGSRLHGTAMSSVAIYGDRASPNSVAIRRPIYFRPVMYAPGTGGAERFVSDRLVVDVIVEAVRTMRAPGSQGEGVIIVNISLGDANRRFGGRLSAWARALDYLSYEFGLLFIVSAGNISDAIDLHYADLDALKAATQVERASTIFQVLDGVKSDRRLLSPAESLNSLTVGAWHSDSSDGTFPEVSYFRPYPSMEMPNLSSALGAGYNRAVKPDVLFPGGRERLRSDPAVSPIRVRPHGIATKHWGLKAAAPGAPGQAIDREAYTLGSSGAAAFATHTAHRIHDAISEAYGEIFLDLPSRTKALIIKAMVSHSASWMGMEEHIRPLLRPEDDGHHERWKRAISRYLGYGFVDPSEAVACATDRATLWAYGTLVRDAAVQFIVPIPSEFGGSRNMRELKATAAWFSSTRPGFQNYRASKVIITGIDRAGTGLQRSYGPPPSQGKAGTLTHVCFRGGSQPRALVDHIVLQVQREVDQGVPIDEPIPFGLAVSLQMDNATEVYTEIRNRVAVKPRVAPRVRV